MYEPEKELHFRAAVEKLQQILKSTNRLYEDMKFNGTSIRVSVDSNVDDLSIIYEQKRELLKLKHDVQE